jgi:predicted MFS family arabinose efflux permease
VARNRQFVAACVVVPLLAAGFFACLLYLPQFMQKLLDYSPLGAGLGLLPLMLVFGAVSFVAGSLYDRLGAKLSTSLGAGCMTVGLFILSFVGSDSGYGAIAPGMAVFGIGVGLSFSSTTTAAVTALDPSRASLAGGVLYMFQVAGGSIGLGLTTAIFMASSQAKVHAAGIADALSTAQEHAVNGILAGTDSAQDLIEQFPHSARVLNALSRQAFASGIQWSFRVAAALAAIGFLVAVGFIGGRLRLRPEPVVSDVTPEAT